MSDETKIKSDKCYCTFLAVNQKESRVITKILYSSQPEKKIKKMNDKLSPGSQSKWEIVMIITPFDTEEQAKLFQESWKDRSRGLVPRREKGLKMASKEDKTVYI